MPKSSTRPFASRLRQIMAEEGMSAPLTLTATLTLTDRLAGPKWAARSKAPEITVQGYAGFIDQIRQLSELADEVSKLDAEIEAAVGPLVSTRSSLEKDMKKIHQAIKKDYKESLGQIGNITIERKTKLQRAAAELKVISKKSTVNDVFAELINATAERYGDEVADFIQTTASALQDMNRRLSASFKGFELEDRAMSRSASMRQAGMADLLAKFQDMLRRSWKRIVQVAKTALGLVQNSAKGVDAAHDELMSVLKDAQSGKTASSGRKAAPDYAWWDRNGRSFKSKTTRAMKMVRKDPAKALKMADELFALMDRHGYPDHWHAVQRVKDDAEFELRMQGGRLASDKTAAGRPYMPEVTLRKYRDGEAFMGYFIDAVKNHSKFYEMAVVPETDGTYTLKKLWGSLGQGHQTLKEETGLTYDQALRLLARQGRKKLRNGYSDAFKSRPAGQYPIGLERSVGFGHGTQAITKCVPALRSLSLLIENSIDGVRQDDASDLLDALEGMVALMSDVPDSMAKEIVKHIRKPLARMKKNPRFIADPDRTVKELMTLKRYIDRQTRECNV